ncbi:hypothetical protein HG536_0G02570 [Torulaspora globosa]|uniref:tRNA pseudouridine(32) synthase n=1 Tax=Torulaspora globosa TaxID=48254 RepID=A0A7G3ZLL0_9SACH|nr:uncharacterized protein HG536_0G02570 [Torulaspora globosa]QLL34396.1 hypothetical protein HG536_0G02570 [Torulaspora globosa]
MLNKLWKSSSLLYRRRMSSIRKNENQPLIDESGSGSDARGSSAFDEQLQKEIESFKRTQQVRLKRQKAKKPGQTAELRDEAGFKLRLADTNQKKHKQTDPDYEVTIEGPLRKIAPYYFTYMTFCKLRWRDRNLLDVFETEFRDRDKSYYKKTIASGSVLLNGQPANLETIIRNGDLITHKIHRHEPAVTSRPIGVVFEDDDILVIDKPSGIPVHPTGRYRFNTITKILEKQWGKTVHPINRLDRLTSGLMFLAKTPRGADEMSDQIKAREVSKEYVARVVGEFPVGEVCVEEPVRSVEPRLGLNAVCKNDDEGAKHAKTVFKRLSYDGQTSIVKCKPFTGRTHQIRVHLQFLGHPIANDPIYSNVTVWGPNLGKGYISDFQDIISKLDQYGRTKCAESWYEPDAQGEALLGEKCSVCETDLYSDPGPNDLDLWLHAYRYESFETDPNTNRKKWSYRTNLPFWALEPHRQYMELALEEAAKCGPTTTAFSVGAVLVNGTEVLSVGYSRELPGNTHAEQCALEKYFAKTGQREVPPGTVLYTTMEPCSFRLSGNEPCVQRIIAQKGRITTVFVGVIEPDTFVKNNTSSKMLSDEQIEYIHIPGYEKICTELATKGHSTNVT